MCFFHNGGDGFCGFCWWRWWWVLLVKVVVGLMLAVVDGIVVVGLMSVGVGMAGFMGLFRP